MSEVRYAIGQLLKSPGFRLVAILGLALGVGGNVRVVQATGKVSATTDTFIALRGAER